MMKTGNLSSINNAFCPRLLRLGVWLLCWTSANALAQAVPASFQENKIHFSYSTLLGTGYYTVGDQSVAVLRVPFSYRVREPGGPGGAPGIRIKVPVTGGFHSFDIDEIPDFDPDSLLTWTVMPGVELNYQLSDRFEVDPGVYIGHGRDTRNNEGSFLWAADVRSRYDLETVKPAMTLGTEALYSGYDPDNGSADSIVRLALGLDMRFPTSTMLLDGNLFVGAHVIGYYYPVSLSFKSFESETLKTSGEMEFGLSFGRYPDFDVFGYKFDRVGIAYRFSDDTSAILLITRFPF